MPGFTVAIVGRPNVGKSTLFNRLLEQRKAIVDDTSGVTRDRQYGIADWNGKTFNVIDTGGFVVGSDDVFEVEIRKQVEIALEEAQLLLFYCRHHHRHYRSGRCFYGSAPPGKQARTAGCKQGRQRRARPRWHRVLQSGLRTSVHAVFHLRLRHRRVAG